MTVGRSIAAAGSLALLLYALALGLLLISLAEIAPLGDVKRWGPAGYLVLIAGAAVAWGLRGDARRAVGFLALFLFNAAFYAAFQAGAFGPSFEILAVQRLVLFGSSVAALAALGRRIWTADKTLATVSLAAAAAVAAAVATVAALGVFAELQRATLF